MLFSFSLKRLNILQMVNRKSCLLLVRAMSDDLIYVCYINASLIHDMAYLLPFQYRLLTITSLTNFIGKELKDNTF